MLDELDDHPLNILNLRILLFQLLKDASGLQVDFFFELVEDGVLVVLFVGGEGGDDILHTINIVEGELPHEPIIHYKPQMLPILLLLNVLVADCERVAHDGDEHVEEVDEDDEAGSPKHQIKQIRHLSFAKGEAALIKLADDHATDELE